MSEFYGTPPWTMHQYDFIITAYKALIKKLREEGNEEELKRAEEELRKFQNPSEREEMIKNPKTKERISKFIALHKAFIEKALKEGENVPDEVLEEYPEFAGKKKDILDEYGYPPFPISLAIRSREGLSYTPERGAKIEKEEYEDYLRKIIITGEKYGLTHDEIQRLIDVFAGKYIQDYKEMASSRSKEVSPLIAGPSGFNSARQRKLAERTRKKEEEVENWVDYFFKKYLPKYLKEREIESSGGEINYLKKQLERLKHAHEVMKEANKIIRSRLSNEEKERKLREIGAFDLRGYTINWPKPDFAGRYGFPDYELTSIREKIKRVEENIKKLEAKEEKKGEVEVSYEGHGFKIVKDYGKDRVMIYFSEIPPADLRAKLKGRGFRWSPHWKAWVRKLTDNAVYTARDILFNYYNIRLPASEKVQESARQFLEARKEEEKPKEITKIIANYKALVKKVTTNLPLSLVGQGRWEKEGEYVFTFFFYAPQDKLKKLIEANNGNIGVDVGVFYEEYAKHPYHFYIQYITKGQKTGYTVYEGYADNLTTAYSVIYEKLKEITIDKLKMKEEKSLKPEQYLKLSKYIVPSFPRAELADWAIKLGDIDPKYKEAYMNDDKAIEKSYYEGMDKIIKEMEKKNLPANYINQALKDLGGKYMDVLHNYMREMAEFVRRKVRGEEYGNKVKMREDEHYVLHFGDIGWKDELFNYINYEHPLKGEPQAPPPKGVATLEKFTGTKEEKPKEFMLLQPSTLRIMSKEQLLMYAKDFGKWIGENTTGIAGVRRWVGQISYEDMENALKNLIKAYFGILNMSDKDINKEYLFERYRIEGKELTESERQREFNIGDFVNTLYNVAANGWDLSEALQEYRLEKKNEELKCFESGGIWFKNRNECAYRQGNVYVGSKTGNKYNSKGELIEEKPREVSKLSKWEESTLKWLEDRLKNGTITNDEKLFLVYLRMKKKGALSWQKKH